MCNAFWRRHYTQGQSACQRKVVRIKEDQGSNPARPREKEEEPAIEAGSSSSWLSNPYCSLFEAGTLKGFWRDEFLSVGMEVLALSARVNRTLPLIPLIVMGTPPLPMRAE